MTTPTFTKPNRPGTRKDLLPECPKHNISMPVCVNPGKDLKAYEVGKEISKEDRHMKICKELNELYKRKNADYGDSFSKSYREYGMTMCCIRLEDKLNRLKSLSGGNKQQVSDESVRDTLIDLANYAILSLLELEQE